MYCWWRNRSRPLIYVQQSVDLGPVKPDDNAAPDFDHRDALLTADPRHISRGVFVTGHVDIGESDTLCLEVLFGVPAVRSRRR
jgi:hypothetical protein